MAARYPRATFDLAAWQRFDPPVGRAIAWFGALQFVALLLAVSAFLWRADTLPLAQSVVWLAALAASLWCVGALMQGRIGWLDVLLIEAAAAATATGALDLVEWHRWFKPAAMMLAIAMVAAQRRADAGAVGRSRMLLLAGLACSLAGDCLLMFPGYFIPGLVAFLAAHLCYIALFKQGGLPWFASRRGLIAALAFGAAMYAFLFATLGPVLRVAVGAYVVVIALMAAQAFGRATVLRDRASMAVAIGAAFFMLSDSLLATDKFALPLPMARLWVLSTYYLAQILIARYALGSQATTQSAAVADDAATLDRVAPELRSS